jgi:HPr kinase/phosphorylase
MDRVTVTQLAERLRATHDLDLLTSEATSGAEISRSEISRPGLLLTGFEQGFDPEIVQILAEQEVAYLESLGDAERESALERLCAASVPCIFIVDGLAPPSGLVERAEAASTAVVATGTPRSPFVRELGAALDDLLAPEKTVHGTLVDVYGVGLLFTGKSGIGKSECALDLVENGHRLVADDVVHVVRMRGGHLIGSGHEDVRHFMELRGLGIVDVQAMFGIRAIRQQKRIEVEVRLATWSDVDDYERLGFDETMTEILGVGIPVVTLPLVPGKNITVISEVIALNHLLKIRGVHPAREFERRLKELSSSRRRARGILEGDTE